MLSAKALTASKSVAPTTIVSFPSAGAYSWTAPAGVTNIIRLTGRGGSGGSEWQVRNNFGATVSNSLNCSIATVHGGSLNWSVPYNRGIEAINLLNTITTDPNGQFINPGVNGVRIEIYYWCNTTSTWRISRSGSSSGQYRRTGTFVPSDPSFPTTGTVPTPNSVNRPIVNSGGTLEQFVLSASGGYSGAFGFAYSFPGGFGSNLPSEATYENISVVPGTQYSFSVGRNIGSPLSFIEFEY